MWSGSGSSWGVTGSGGGKENLRPRTRRARQQSVSGNQSPSEGQASHPPSCLPQAGADVTLAGMNTLAEVEAAVPQFSAEELAELEQCIRQARLKKNQGGGRSPLELPPLDLGRMLKPLGTREEWCDEMLEGRV